MEKAGKMFSLVCDLEGQVIEILRDPDKILSPSIVGNMFFSTVVPSDLEKILNFFLELKIQGRSIGWEINIALTRGIETFTFFGGIFDDHIGIAAATSKNSAQLLFEEITRINNEQTNPIGTVSKEYVKLHNSSNEPVVSVYDELSRLNNELVNMQRELYKKNHELDELSKLKNHFLEIAAHDLRGPVSVILDCTGTLLVEKPTLSADENIELIRHIDKNARVIQSLVNDLTDISLLHPESGDQ